MSALWKSPGELLFERSENARLHSWRSVERKQDWEDLANKQNPPKAIDAVSIRDYFAAKAMQAYVGSDSWRVDFDQTFTALAAYQMADAMLKARQS